MRLAVIGVGLIGGSIGLAARQRLDAEVAGFDSDPRNAERGARAGRPRPRRRLGRRGGRRGRDRLLRGARSAPSPGWWPRRSRRAAEDAVVTDVGSTKEALLGRAVRRAGERFIGGHPLAGAETAGVENARADLFEGARWYLTPDRALERRPLRPPAARDRRPRRPAPGHRRRDPRPADGDGQPRSPRDRQRARSGGGGRRGRGVRAASRGRPELSRHDPSRRGEPGHLGRHLRHQPRGGRPRGRRRLRASAGGRRADPLRGHRRGGGLAHARPARTADACSRPSSRAASCASSGSRSRTGRAPWPRSRWRWAAPGSTSRTWRSTRHPTCAPAPSRCGWPATTEAERAGRDRARASATPSRSPSDPLRPLGPPVGHPAGLPPDKSISHRAALIARDGGGGDRGRRLPRRRRHEGDPGARCGRSGAEVDGGRPKGPADSDRGRRAFEAPSVAARDRRRQRRDAASHASRVARRAGRGSWTLDGDESIRRRPVDRVAEPLRLMGAEVDCRDGRLPPLRVERRRPARDRLPAARGKRPGEVVRAARRAPRRGRDLA